MSIESTLSAVVKLALWAVVPTKYHINGVVADVTEDLVLLMFGNYGS